MVDGQLCDSSDTNPEERIRKLSIQIHTRSIEFGTVRTTKSSKAASLVISGKDTPQGVSMNESTRKASRPGLCPSGFDRYARRLPHRLRRNLHDTISIGEYEVSIGEPNGGRGVSIIMKPKRRGC